MTAELVSLFEYPSEVRAPLAPWQKHSPTSRAAAKSIQPKTPSLRDKVLAMLRFKAMTDEELAKALDMNPSTCRPRRIELVELGLVESVSTALTASGRKAQVWRAVPTTESA